MTLSIGQQYNPFVLPQRDDPHPVWQRCRTESPVFFSEKLGVWIVTQYDDVAKVIGDAASYKNAGATENSLPVPSEVKAVLAKGLSPVETRSPLVLDAPEHLHIKKVLMALFTPKRVAALEARGRETANELIDAFIHDGHADFVSQFAYRLPIAMLFDMIGIPHEDAEKLHEWSNHKMALQWGSLDLDEHLVAAQGYVDFQMYLLDLVNKSRANPADDAVSTLINLRVAGERPLSDAEIVGLMMGIIAAGHESTTNMLTLCLWHALENRSIWEGICADPGTIPQFVEEGLRFDNPVTTLWRRAAADVVLSDQEIPAGARLALIIASANRDAAKFANADVFDPARKPEVTSLVFGRGGHYCVGASLALAEGKTAFEELTRRIPSMRLKDGFLPNFAANAALRIMDTLPVEWDV